MVQSVKRKKVLFIVLVSERYKFTRNNPAKRWHKCHFEGLMATNDKLFKVSLAGD